MHSTVDQYLFLHGGPGLNSEAERRLLNPLLKNRNARITFFNEPSRLRPDGPSFDESAAWSGWLRAAQTSLSNLNAPVTVIGCSFAALVAEHLVKWFPDHISRLVLVSPTPQLQQTFLRMMDLAIMDLQSSDCQTSDQLKQFRSGTRSFFDADCQAGLALTFQDSKLFSHYWKNRLAMQSWTAVLTEPQFCFDTTSQRSVFLEMAKSSVFPQPTQKSNAPVQICVGRHDPVVRPDEVRDYYVSRFSKVEVTVFDNSGHFPQLEEPQNWLEHIISPLAFPLGH